MTNPVPATQPGSVPAAVKDASGAASGRFAILDRRLRALSLRIRGRDAETVSAEQRN